jgi:hypothetical protein
LVSKTKFDKKVRKVVDEKTEAAKKTLPLATGNGSRKGWRARPKASGSKACVERREAAVKAMSINDIS